MTGDVRSELTAGAVSGRLPVPAWAGAAILCCLPVVIHPLLSSTTGQRVWLGVVVWMPVAAVATSLRLMGATSPGWPPLLRGMAIHATGMTISLLPLADQVQDTALIASTVLAWPLYLRAFRAFGGQRRNGGLGVALDVAILTLAIATVFWATVLGPRGYLVDKTGTELVVDGVGMLLATAAVSLVLRWVLNHRTLPGYVAILAAGAITGCRVPLVHWGFSLHQPLYAGAAAPLLGLAYGLVSAAALHPSVVHRDASVADTGEEAWIVPRLVLMGGSLAVPVAIQAGCEFGLDLDCGPSTLLLEGLLVATVVWRLVHAVRGRQLSQQRLTARDRLFASVAMHAADGVVLFHRDGTVRFATPAAESLAGQSVVGRAGLDVLHPPDRDLVMDAFREAARQPGQAVQVTARPAAAPDRWLEMRVTDHTADRDIQAFVANVHDVTAEREHAFTLQRMAFSDPLTGLANRASLLATLEAHLAEGRRITALFCDLDRLKVVNDTFGHALGDRLLLQSAERLRAVIPEQAVLGRLGGDEFLILLPDSDEAQSVVVAEQVRATLGMPFDLAGRQMQVSCSIGLVTSDEDHTASALVAEADLAMYRAKELGRDRVVVFDDYLRAEQTRVTRTRAELPTALEGDQLVVHWQPVVQLRTGRMWGAEALVRWQHPRDGLLLPDSFIDVAEETGLIARLGGRVLQEALQTANARRDLGVVSVNVSGQQLADDSFTDALLQAVRGGEPVARRVLLEVTERTLVGGSPEIVARLERLRDAGVRVALDDFGTGYASFATMRTLPLDILKVDQSLLPEPFGHGTVLEAIVTMAHSLGLEVIVEGVEHPAQLRMAIELQADMVQGFLLGAPGPVVDLPAGNGMLLATDTLGGKRGSIRRSAPTP